MQKVGFTLIELLVVVLIIGVLTAVAVPQYQKAVERSRATEVINLLSSIAKAYQTYYLANGQYATKFEQLDVDIPFTGNTKFLPHATDTKSNQDWSFQIENSAGYTLLYAGRISGKYKGSGFSVAFVANSETATKRIRCFERKINANILFDTALPAGSYCKQILNGTFPGEDDFSRTYAIFQ